MKKINHDRPILKVIDSKKRELSISSSFEYSKNHNKRLDFTSNQKELFIISSLPNIKGTSINAAA